VVIPARMASTRLPDKPLADIGGVPMVVRAWRQAAKAGIGPVLVAAAEREIADCVRAAGGQAVLTDPALPSGTDRMKAALDLFDPEGAHDVAVNLQCDWPALNPAHVKLVAETLAPTGADIATLAAEITDPADFDNPHAVKAVVTWDVTRARGRALYFTRARAPSGEGPLFVHVGIYAFKRNALQRFVALPPSPLEIRERLEQLRALEAGMSIAVARIDEVPLSVDTPEDLQAARAQISKD